MPIISSDQYHIQQMVTNCRLILGVLAKVVKQEKLNPVKLHFFSLTFVWCVSPQCGSIRVDSVEDFAYGSEILINTMDKVTHTTPEPAHLLTCTTVLSVTCSVLGAGVQLPGAAGGGGGREGGEAARRRVLQSAVVQLRTLCHVLSIRHRHELPDLSGDVQPLVRTRLDQNHLCGCCTFVLKNSVLTSENISESRLIYFNTFTLRDDM